ncbi:12956_t:CDS:1, partial [Cetraspora pellucida]
IIVTESLIDKTGNDKMEDFKHLTDKCLRIMNLDEYTIIDYLKEEFFADYEKHNEIKNDDARALFLHFMNSCTKVFSDALIKSNILEWDNKMLNILKQWLT